MSDDFDEMFEQLTNEGGEDPATPPAYRATIHNGKVTLTGWAPWLISWGPLGERFKARARAGVAIADLTFEGEDRDEVIVRFRSLGRSLEDAEQAIIDWARVVGIRRLWLTDRVVDLEPNLERMGRAMVRCPTCKARWSDSAPEFWLTVQESRQFPHWCPLCGNELPEWTVEAPNPKSAPRGERGGHAHGEQAASDRAAKERHKKS